MYIQIIKFDSWVPYGMAAPLASSIGTRIFFSKTPRVFAYFSTHWRSLNHFFMYTCRKIIGIILANIIFGIHVSLASFFANCSSRSDDI